MKLAYVAPYSSSFSLTANCIHVFKMCDAYTTLGIDISLYLDGINSKTVPNKKYQQLFDLNTSFNLVCLSDLSFFRFFKLIFQIPYKISRDKIDVVHTRNLAVAFGTSVIFGLPTLLELHNMPSSNFKVKFMFNIFIRNKNSKGLISITKSLATDVKSNYKLKCPIFVFPDGVSQKYLVGSFDKCFLKNELIPNLSKNIWIVYTGSFYKGKGPDFILKLAKYKPEYKFVLIGKYSDLHSSEAPDNVVLIGERDIDDTVKFQRAADVLLLPLDKSVIGVGSSSENISKYTSPLKMFEYMASKTPIISSNLSVLQEILKDQSNSLICEIDLIDNWVKNIDELISNQKLANSLSERAFLDVQKFTWEERAKNILSLLNL